MALHVDVKGADTLERTLDGAAEDLARMDAAAAETSRVIAAAGAIRAPRATGTLAGSIQPEPVGPVAAAGSSLTYAPYVHWGTKVMAARPFLIAAARQTEAVWTAEYVKGADQALSHVKGT